MREITLSGGPGDGKTTLVQPDQGLFMWPEVGGCHVYVILSGDRVATYDGFEPWVEPADD